MTADCTDHTSTTMTTNATATINTFAATRCPLLQPLHYYRSRCYGMTGVSPHSDTFFLHQLPDPGWSPGRQAGYPGAGREGYWATHQNTGACCWHGSLKCMEEDYKTTEIDTLPDKESQQG